MTEDKTPHEIEFREEEEIRLEQDGAVQPSQGKVPKPKEKKQKADVVRIDTTISRENKNYLADLRIKYADVLTIGVDVIHSIIDKIMTEGMTDQVKAFIDMLPDPSKKVMRNISMTAAVFSNYNV